MQIDVTFDQAENLKLKITQNNFSRSVTKNKSLYDNYHAAILSVAQTFDHTENINQNIIKKAILFRKRRIAFNLKK